MIKNFTYFRQNYVFEQQNHVFELQNHLFHQNFVFCFFLKKIFFIKILPFEFSKKRYNSHTSIQEPYHSDFMQGWGLGKHQKKP